MTEKITRTRKKKTNYIEWPLTDFNQKPVVGNPNNIEEGNFVTLERSMIDLESYALWIRGVEARVTKLSKTKEDIMLADVNRSDGTPAKLYACWLNPCVIEKV